jgi:hypothetical protein
MSKKIILNNFNKYKVHLINKILTFPQELSNQQFTN